MLLRKRKESGGIGDDDSEFGCEGFVTMCATGGDDLIARVLL